MKSLIKNYQLNKSIIKESLALNKRVDIFLNAFYLFLLILVPIIYLLIPFYLDVNLQLFISILMIIFVSGALVFLNFLKYHFYKKEIDKEFSFKDILLIESIMIIIPVIIIGIILIVIFL